MKEFIPREAMSFLRSTLDRYDCALFLGPRQVGKTVLAQELGGEFGAACEYLELDQKDGSETVSNFEIFAEHHAGKLVILDEAQCVPELFPKLRRHLDKHAGNTKPRMRFLLLGSATVDLLSLANSHLGGRFGAINLTSLHLAELSKNLGARALGVTTFDTPEAIAVLAQQDVSLAETIKLLWLRGGFPLSYLSDSSDQSIDWRLNYLQSTFGPQAATALLPGADQLDKLWQLLALQQGEPCNTQKLGEVLGCKKLVIEELLRYLIQNQLVREVKPWFKNERKRLNQPSRMFIRDSGLLHSLWKFREIDDLLAHQIKGKSWEGFVLETLLSSAPHGTVPYFYRNSLMDEVDIILEFDSRSRWAIEVKLNDTPTVSKGFYRAAPEIEASQQFVVHGGPNSFQIGGKTPIEALSLSDVIQRI